MKKEKIRAIIKERKEDYWKHLEKESDNLKYQIIGEFLRQLKGYFLKNGFEVIDFFASDNSMTITTQGFKIYITLGEIESSVRLSILGCNEIEAIECDIMEHVMEYLDLKCSIIYYIVEMGFFSGELGKFVLKFFEKNKQALLDSKEKYEKDKQFEGVREEFFKSVISLVQEKIPSNYQVEYFHYVRHTIKITFRDISSHRIRMIVWVFDKSIEVKEHSCCLDDRIELEDSLLNLIVSKKISTEEFAKKVLHIFNQHKECTQEYEQEEHDEFVFNKFKERRQKYEQENQNECEISKLLKVALKEKFKRTNFYIHELDDNFYVSTIEKISRGYGVTERIEYSESQIRCRHESRTSHKQVQAILQQTEPNYYDEIENVPDYYFDKRDLKKELNLETLGVKDVPKIADYIYQYCLEHKEWLTQMNKLYEEFMVLTKDFVSKTHEILQEKLKDELNWELEIQERFSDLELNLNFKSDKKEKLDFNLLTIEGLYFARNCPESFFRIKNRENEPLNYLKMVYFIKDTEQDFKADFYCHLDKHNVEDALNLEKDFLESLRDKSLNADNYSAFIYDYFKKHQEVIEVLNENIEEFVLG
ncbi:hypothetical protein [Helicobacter cetorum]|uniref:hypothetical protein n=1 Tax=Helicobacter cetorum TaxID=138563 RepID=UPI000CF079BD|nr:hypothetical protein [Helicobacter cetorum]